MRHRKKLSKLSRPTDQRLAMLKSLARELLIHKRITTTYRRAEAASKTIEKIVALAKKGDLNSRRSALRILPDKRVIKKFFEEAKNIFKERTSGFTRIVKCGLRRGDAAERAIIELTEIPEK